VVNNGCTGQEKEMIIHLCNNHSRLEYYELSADNIFAHGAALSHLQSIEESDYFCFMDPDIFAVGNFMDKFTPLLPQHSGVFSGSAIWQPEQDQIIEKSNLRVGGRFHWTSDDFCLGSSFFAIYHNSTLSQLLKTTDFTFDKYLDWQKIPPKFREEIEKIGLKKEAYDTGKIINIMLQVYGHKIIYKDSKTLWHLGGLSSLLIGPLSKVPPKGIKRIRKNISTLISLKSIINKAARKEREYQLNTKYIRYDAAQYFTKILHCLFNDIPITATLKIKDETVSKKMQIARNYIEDLYNEFQDELRYNN
ncbi:MAG: hypothetical protein KAT07_13565, partial [Calditrichia bacterium]|nr:hypothetical protein [Calditrichia bacterium]